MVPVLVKEREGYGVLFESSPAITFIVPALDHVTSIGATLPLTTVLLRVPLLISVPPPLEIPSPVIFIVPLLVSVAARNFAPWLALRIPDGDIVVGEEMVPPDQFIVPLTTIVPEPDKLLPTVKVPSTVISVPIPSATVNGEELFNVAPIAITTWSAVMALFAVML